MPLLDMVRLWLFEGRLDDPGREFFILRSEEEEGLPQGACVLGLPSPVLAFLCTHVCVCVCSNVYAHLRVCVYLCSSARRGWKGAGFSILRSEEGKEGLHPGACKRARFIDFIARRKACPRVRQKGSLHATAVVCVLRVSAVCIVCNV